MEIEKIKYNYNRMYELLSRYCYYSKQWSEKTEEVFFSDVEEIVKELNLLSWEKKLSKHAVSGSLPSADELAKKISEMSDEDFKNNCKRK
jgi:hypothetical protein